jgi:diguanylate cyclase (GGDEF)-like protein
VRGEDGRWFLPASAGQLDAERAAADGLLPLTAFQYAVRTREVLVVEDAARDDRFARDSYVAAAPRCSLMIVPIPHGGDIPAWIVLANRQTSGLFTADRLDAVSMITGQLVVSHRNAMLYASLEARVAERTRELAEANGKLEILSATDALTGLANRRRFEHELSTGAPPALIMIDVDFFKKYNDRYGHQAGDECLRRVGGALAESVRRTDLVCRYGGEEFVIMLDGADEAVALSVGEEVRAAVQRLAIPHEDSPSGVVTVSAGVAASIEDPAELLRRADSALYEAKAAGRNRVLSPAQPG